MAECGNLRCFASCSWWSCPFPTLGRHAYTVLLGYRACLCLTMTVNKSVSGDKGAMGMFLVCCKRSVLCQFRPFIKCLLYFMMLMLTWCHLWKPVFYPLCFWQNFFTAQTSGASSRRRTLQVLQPSAVNKPLGKMVEVCSMFSYVEWKAVG